MYFPLLVLCIAVFSLVGCAGTAIPKENYSQLATPQETCDFARKAVASDDPAAFYYCLSERTQKQVSLSDLELGWALAGGFFYLFLEANVKSIENPAPEPMFYGSLSTAKVTVQSNDLTASFLLYRESQKWKIIFPSPYPLPDIGKIKKKAGLPWRNELLVHYEADPADWFSDTKIDRKKNYVSDIRKPRWRTE